MAKFTAFSELSSAVRELVASISASVVSIQGRPRHPATALVVGPERLVTTSHSVEWDEHVRVRVPGGPPLSATVAGRDPATDLVLLHAPGLAAPALRFTDRVPESGELALVTGRGWSGHLVARLVTLSRLDGPIRLGRGRTVDTLLGLGLTPYTGFSGSAVITADGDVAGISTTGLMRGAGLALPTTTVRATLDALGRDGRVRRGFLGISSQPVTVPSRQRPDGDPERGLLVVEVAPDAPADRAGVLVGDILVQFDGADVSDPETLLGRLTAERIGQSIGARVIRGRESVPLTLVIGERA